MATRDDQTTLVDHMTSQKLSLNRGEASVFGPRTRELYWNVLKAVFEKSDEATLGIDCAEQNLEETVSLFHPLCSVSRAYCLRNLQSISIVPRGPKPAVVVV